MNRAGAVLALMLVALSVQAAAPAERPAEKPAVDTAKVVASSPVGTTIVGDQDSELGLNLLPWQREHADDIDPPPGLHDVAPEPLDRRALARSIDDAAVVQAWRRQQQH